MRGFIIINLVYTLFIFASLPPITTPTDETSFLTMIKKEHDAFTQKQEAKALHEKRIRLEKERLAKIKAIKTKLQALAKKKKIILKQLALAQKEEAHKKKIALEKARKAKIARAKHVLAKIDISQQRMKVYKGDTLLYNWKVSTGRKGHSTPTGHYRPTSMERLHRSRKYNNARMPYSVFFRSGYAVHGTKSVSRLGRRASHGCVRLHTSNAKKFYKLVRKAGRHNTSIRIVN